MRVLAVLTVRDEARILPQCLDHLARHGVEAIVVDHASTDGSRELAASRLGHGVIAVEDQPWTGAFELVEQLRVKERLIAAHRADWYLHLDADEVREAPPPYATLVEGLADADRLGFNAVDFDEFVFVPTAEDGDHEPTDPYAELRCYYHFEPRSPDRWRINAWKRIDGVSVDLVGSGGHEARFPGRRVFPRPFVMRHYPVLSARHAVAKYGSRRFSEQELAQQWHADRVTFRAEALRLPSRAEVRVAPATARDALDPSMPWDGHPFLGGRSGPAVRASAPVPPRRDRELVREYAARHHHAVPRFNPVPADGVGRTTERHWITVALPVHEPDPALLAEAIGSVLAQDSGPSRMEVLVVDDGTASLDVRALVHELAGDRVRVVRPDRRLGLPAAWNACIEAATGEIVHVLHQDDRVLPGFYDRLVRPMRDDPALVGAFCRTAGIDGRGEVRWTMVPSATAPASWTTSPSRRRRCTACCARPWSCAAARTRPSGATAPTCRTAPTGTS